MAQVTRKPKQAKALWTKMRRGLKPGGWNGEKPRERRRVNRVSKLQRQRNAQYLAELRPWMEEKRASGEVCPVIWHIFGNRILVSENHHVRGRDGPLLLDKRWWLAVSSEGHKWIDANRKQAQEYGWLAGKGEWGKAEP